MLSKSTGQILRISAAFHVLFHVKKGSITTDNDNLTDKDNDDEHEDKKDDEHEDKDDNDNNDNEDKHVETNSSISTEISEEAVAAAINFVQLCCQQTAFMAGRCDIEEEIEIVNASMSTIHVYSSIFTVKSSIGLTEPNISDSNHSTKTQSDGAPGHCLTLPGKKLNLTALLYAKKLRAHGYRKGGIKAFKELESAGLGVMEKHKVKSGVVSIVYVC